MTATARLVSFSDVANILQRVRARFSLRSPSVCLLSENSIQASHVILLPLGFRVSEIRRGHDGRHRVNPKDSRQPDPAIRQGILAT
jgi:hypothetical protein